MENNRPKKRVAISYNNLPAELQQELRKKYPYGFSDAMIRIEKGPGDFFYAVVFDTEDTSYLVKIDVKVDVDGNLEEEEDKDYYDDEITGAEDIIADEADDE